MMIMHNRVAHGISSDTFSAVGNHIKVITPHKPVTWFVFGVILISMSLIPDFSIAGLAAHGPPNKQVDVVMKILFAALGLGVMGIGFWRCVTSVQFTEDGVTINKLFGGRFLPWDQIRQISFDNVNFSLGHEAKLLALQQVTEKWMIIVTEHTKQIWIDAQRGKALKTALDAYSHKLKTIEAK